MAGSEGNGLVEEEERCVVPRLPLGGPAVPEREAAGDPGPRLVVAHDVSSATPLVQSSAVAHPGTPPWRGDDLAEGGGRKAIFVLHGSGAPFTTSSFVYHRLLGSAFEWLVVRVALRLSLPISLSRAGVGGARRRYGVEAAHVPYPLRDLSPATPRSLRPDEPLRIVWVGRLYREKNPLLAVEIVERVRRSRDATLRVYGSGVLWHELWRLARDRPWLTLCGPRSWSEIQEAQDAGHVCLSTSLRDATQIAILEPLARGIPVVSTRVGDAPSHYVSASLQSFCVDEDDPDAAAAAILELASSYTRRREEFAANADQLRARHARGPERLSSLLETAAFGEPDEWP